MSGTLATGNDQTIFCLAGDHAKAACDEDMCGTLAAHDAKGGPMVAIAANQRGEVRLQNGDGSITGAIPASQSGKQFNGLAGAGYVRRLTPRECERLQGFPDDWTLVPYSGRPAEGCPDGPRYKAIGNSMAVPVMRWIGERIAAALLLAGEGGIDGGEAGHGA